MSYDNEQNVDNNEDFDAMLGLRDRPGDSEPGNGTGRQEDGQPDPNAEIKALKEQLAQRDAKITEMSGDLDKLRPAAQTVEKMQQAFLGDEDAQRAQVAKEELTRSFDEDPAGTLDRILADRDQRLMAALEKKERTRDVKDIMREVEQEWDVDWKNSGKKIKETLNNFSPDYKESDLKGALIAAIELNKAGKKRKTLPHMEGSSLSPEQQEKRRLDYETEVKKRILKHKDSADPLRGFFNEAQSRK